MKSILRLYLATSKGNDYFLFKELLRFKIKPRFDSNLHAFYFDAPMATIFKIAHRSLIAENMHIQIGKPFPATSETVFQQKLQKIQFKNYLPLRRNLIENLSLSILIRQTQYPISENAMTSFIHNALQKQIVKRQYFKQILQGDIVRDALPNYYDMKQIVQRKWEQQDILIQSKQSLLQGPDKKDLLQNQSKDSVLTQTQRSQLSRKQSSIEPTELTLPYQPHITVYVRRNNARLLLKVNEQQMYKLGWKKRVGWAPVRQSIATAIVTQSSLLESKQQVFLWDPFCGSGTIGLVAAAMHHGAWVRMDASNFNWQYWAIYQPEYLQQYFKDEQAESKTIENKLNIIMSDINFKAANYTIQNLKQLLKSIENKQQNHKQKQNPLIKRNKPTQHWSEVLPNQWVVGCGDFEKLADSVLLPGRKVTIITNLPYFQARSAEHMPLSQLVSVYRRFSKMIRKYKDRISNVFILIDNNNAYLTHPNHFLSVSEEKWTIINSFESGGRPVGFYAWQLNETQVQSQDSTALISQLRKQAELVKNAPDEQLTSALMRYRKKVSQIQKKNYYLPQHLKKIKKGWRRVKEKRRRRHMLRTYDLFARKRDKMIAFAEYARKKLQVKMLRRGQAWRKRNTRLLSGLPIQNLEKELKKQFEGRIEKAIALNEQKQQYRKQRAKEANETLGKNSTKKPQKNTSRKLPDSRIKQRRR